MDECIVGDVFYGLDSVTTQLAKASLEALGYSLSSLIGAWAAVYMAWRLINAIGGRFDPQTNFMDIASYIFILMLVSAVLAGGAATDFWWPIFDFLKNLGPWAGTKILEVTGSVEVKSTGIGGLLCATELVFLDHIFGQLFAMADDIDIWAKLSVIVGVVLLCIPFMVLVWTMIKSVIGSYFKIMGIGILSPFMIAALADKSTRPIFIAGLKIMLTSALELFLAAAAASAVLIIMSGIFDLTESAPESGANVIFSKEYWQLLLTGVLLMFLYHKLIEVAGMALQVFGETADKGISAKKIGSFGLSIAKKVV
ncbi:hypothetical protein O4H49_20280 [Kiloniella laminariae]|uniref:Conjugal transfer protein TrbL n=1 Tax=Kiloniella laminariae TaxID=454162 RepID=A0ABT4LPS2_9PROT|nr:hypothetical protein [Kiloniella laminariae]MCZ4283133.1 hypothetical protein [Kiloniella laminariae]